MLWNSILILVSVIAAHLLVGKYSALPPVSSTILLVLLWQDFNGAFGLLYALAWVSEWPLGLFTDFKSHVISETFTAEFPFIVSPGWPFPVNVLRTENILKTGVSHYAANSTLLALKDKAVFILFCFKILFFFFFKKTNIRFFCDLFLVKNQQDAF